MQSRLKPILSHLEVLGGNLHFFGRLGTPSFTVIFLGVGIIFQRGSWPFYKMVEKTSRASFILVFGPSLLSGKGTEKNSSTMVIPLAKNQWLKPRGLPVGRWPSLTWTCRRCGRFFFGIREKFDEPKKGLRNFWWRHSVMLLPEMVFRAIRWCKPMIPLLRPWKSTTISKDW